MPNTSDNCWLVGNANQSNLDGDLFGDSCDGDMDGDGVPNYRDNCPRVPNKSQSDGNYNNIGDVCDTTGLPHFRPVRQGS